MVSTYAASSQLFRLFNHTSVCSFAVLGMLVLWVSQILLMGKHKQTLLSYARKCEVLNDASLDRQSHRIVSRAEPCDHSLPEEPDLNNAGASGEGGAKTADRSPTAHIPNLDCSVEGGDVRTGGTAKTSTETTTTAPAPAAAAAAAAAAADTDVDVAVFAMEEVTWGSCESDPYSTCAIRKAIREEAIHAEAKKSNQPAAKSSSDETESLASSKSACLVSWKLRLLRLYIVAIYFFAGISDPPLPHTHTHTHTNARTHTVSHTLTHSNTDTYIIAISNYGNNVQPNAKGVCFAQICFLSSTFNGCYD